MADAGDTPTPDLLRAYLAAHDEPCPRCGYNLRMLEGRNCPECGSALRLKVGLVEPRLAAYITTLVMCCIGFGGPLLISALILTQVGVEWWTDMTGWSGWLMLAMLVVTGAALPVLVFGRRMFTRRSPAVQWGLAVMTTGGVLLMCLVLVVFWRE